MSALFVYGTLKRGELRAGLTSRAIRVVEARVEGRLYALAAGYPAMVVDEAHGAEPSLAAGGRDSAERALVHGEVAFFAPGALDLAVLDAYEGFDPADEAASLYLRRVVRATLVTGDTIAAYAYVFPADREATLEALRARRLHDGRWSAGLHRL